MTIYYLTPIEMLLQNLYKNEEVPECIKEIDRFEQIHLNEEQEILKEYSKHKITASKIAFMVTTSAFTVIAFMTGALLFPSITLKQIDYLAYAGIFIGSIVGYIIGTYMDRAGVTNRMAMYKHNITPKRIERMNDKLKKVNDIISNNNSINLTKVKEHIEKCLKEKGDYNRFHEFLNIRQEKK